MLTCKETSYLASKKLDKRLSLYEYMGFWVHIVMCSLCRRYARDIEKLHRLLQKTEQTSKQLLPESVKLSKQAHDRIKHRLDQAFNKTE